MGNSCQNGSNVSGENITRSKINVIENGGEPSVEVFSHQEQKMIGMFPRHSASYSKFYGAQLEPIEHLQPSSTPKIEVIKFRNGAIYDGYIKDNVR